MFRAPRSQQCALLCTCHKWGWQKHKHTSEIRSGLVCITGTETWFLTAYKDLNNTQKSTSLTKVTWCFMSSQPVQLHQGEVQQKAACNRKLDTSTSAQSMNWSWGSNPQWQVVHKAWTEAEVQTLSGRYTRVQLHTSKSWILSLAHKVWTEAEVQTLSGRYTSLQLHASESWILPLAHKVWTEAEVQTLGGRYMSLQLHTMESWILPLTHKAWTEAEVQTLSGRYTSLQLHATESWRFKPLVADTRVYNAGFHWHCLFWY